MKKKSDYKSVNTNTPTTTIPRSMVNKLGMLLLVIIPITSLLAYAMEVNFFTIARIISAFILIISIIAYIKEEVIYDHTNTVVNKKKIVNQKHKIKFSFSLKKGTVQVVLSTLIIILCTYLGQVIYKFIR